MAVKLHKLFLIILLVKSSFCEYLIYKQTGSKIALPTEDEHKNEVMPILAKYQFPASSNPANNISEDDMHSLNENEHVFIEGKLLEQNENYRVIFIPTILYELFVISKFLDRRSNLWAELILKHITDLFKKIQPINIAEFEQLYKKEKDNPFFKVPTGLTQQSAFTIPSQETRNDLLGALKKYINEANDLLNNQTKTTSEKHDKLRVILEDVAQELSLYADPLSKMGGLYRYIMDLMRVWDGGRAGELVSMRLCDFPETSQYESFCNLLKKENQDTEIVKAHYAINNSLVLTLKRLGLLQLNKNILGKKYALKFLRQLIKWISNSLRGPGSVIKETPGRYNVESHYKIFMEWAETVLYRGLAHKEGIGRKTFERIVELEYKVEPNAVLIYRGTPLYNGLFAAPFQLIDGKIKPWNVSFGTTLFSGVFLDAKACAFPYIVESEVGVAVKVNKADYINQCKSNTNIVYITPYLTVIPLLRGVGGSFHARTRYWKEIDITKQREIIGGLITIKCEAAQRIYISKLNLMDFTRKFGNFFADNTFFLKSQISTKNQASPASTIRNIEFENEIIENERNLYKKLVEFQST